MRSLTRNTESEMPKRSQYQLTLYPHGEVVPSFQQLAMGWEINETETRGRLPLDLVLHCQSEYSLTTLSVQSIQNSTWSV